MISVIISKENILGDMIEIVDKSNLNHLKNSVRIMIDEKVRAVDGEFEYICRVVHIDKKRVELKVLEKKEDSYSSDVEIDIALGILKNDKMDLAIQKLTEIGVSRIIPLVTKRGVVKLTEKKDKWDKVVEEATKQCQAVKLVEIMEPLMIKELKIEDYDFSIVPYEEEEEHSLREILNRLEKKPKKILYIIGSEGGFEKEEVEYLKGKGVKSVSLGRRILRAETASIVVGGILRNEF